jgi:hypothetical protein
MCAKPHTVDRKKWRSRERMTKKSWLGAVLRLESSEACLFSKCFQPSVISFSFRADGSFEESW